MGSTILQSFGLSSPGLLLQESFESVNFMTDQAWTLLNGSPVTTNAASFDSLKSLLMTLTYPQIEKTVTSYTFSSGYFLDDATQTVTGFQPFILWKTSGGQIFGLGVANATSTGFYTKIVNGVLSATAIPRVNGWHRFSIKDVALVADMQIDNVSVGGAAHATAFNRVDVGCRVYAGATAFGYFDLIEICQTQFLSVYGLEAGQVVSAFDSTNTLIATATVVPAGDHVDLAVSNLNSPFTAYITITRKDGLRPYFITASQSFSSGDTWKLDVFDLGRRVPSFQLAREAMRDDKESTSGRNESLFYYSRDKVQLTLSDLTEDQRHRFSRWWGNAAQGSIFSVAIDSDNTYYNRLTAAATLSQSVTAASTQGANRKSFLMLKQMTGTKFEVGKVQTIVGAQINFDQSLANSYAIGDTVRNVYYWPFCITLDKDAGLKLINAKLKRWTATINFKEALF